MTPLLQLQLVTSFLVGGAAVTVLTLIAERTDQRTAGIILSLPSTLAVSLFFIGWTLSPGAVAEAAPVIPIALGVSMLFSATYVGIARRYCGPKIASIVASVAGSMALWFVLAVPLAVYRFTNVPASLAGYVVLTLIAHLLLTREPGQPGPNIRVHYTGAQKLGRAIFAGTMIAVIVYISKMFGPLWGGIFSIFPAANSSTLLILHWQRDAGVLKKVCRHMPLGSPIFLVYVLAAALAFPRFGIVLGTLLSYGASLLVLWAYLALLHRKPDEVVIEPD